MEATPLTPQEMNPWKTIFFKPKETIEWVLENNPEQFYWKLFLFCFLEFLITVTLDFDPTTGGLKLGGNRSDPLYNIFRVIISPFITLIATYAYIYIITYFTNLIAGFLGNKVPFKLAKETLLWISYPSSILVLGTFAWRGVTSNLLGLNLIVISELFGITQIFYGIFIQANTYMGLYKFSKAKSYIWASINQLPVVLLFLIGVMYRSLK